MNRRVLTVLATGVVLLAWAQAGAQDAMTTQKVAQVSLQDVSAKLDEVALWTRYAAVLAGLALLSSLWNAHHLYTVAKNQVAAAKAMADKS